MHNMEKNIVVNKKFENIQLILKIINQELSIMYFE